MVSPAGAGGEAGSCANGITSELGIEEALCPVGFTACTTYRYPVPFDAVASA
jgi:hypothetical protein